MKQTTLTALVIALIAFTSHSLSAQGKITSDPNAPGKQATTPKEETDTRLAQKITYDSGYKRLHAVTDDLSRMTGVDILSGQSKKDWRVRDIPVVVCVKDLPLGKLLRAIADTTHTSFSSEKIGDNPKKSYRIYRRSADETDIDLFFARRHKARLEAVKWQWDVMAAYGKSQEITGVPRNTWLVARLIASLGPEAQSKLLSGGMFEFNGKDPESQSIIDELYPSLWENTRLTLPKKYQSVALPEQDQIEASILKIKLIDTGESGDTDVNVSLSPLAYGKVVACSSDTLHMADALADANLVLPACPESAEAPTYQQDMDNPDMRLLSRKEEWNTTPLNREIGIERPKDIQKLTFADLIRALAQAGEVNIVTEDFTSQDAGACAQLDQLFKEGTNLASTLASLIHEKGAKHPDYVWFFNESTNLLVGWADDAGSRRWRNHHLNLLPEAYLSQLKSKLNGPGVDFDEAVHLMCLPKDSYAEWIRCSADLGCLSNIQPEITNDVEWKVYDRLTPEEKQTAKTQSGLSLSKFDPDWISGFLKAQYMAEPIPNEAPLSGNPDKSEIERMNQMALDERKLVDRIMSDPQIISTIIMRVKQSPAESRRYAGTYGPVPAGLRLSRYDIVIGYQIDEEAGERTVCGPALAFPVWSFEREAEIIKAQTAEGK